MAKEEVMIWARKFLVILGILTMCSGSLGMFLLPIPILKQWVIILISIGFLGIPLAWFMMTRGAAKRREHGNQQLMLAWGERIQRWSPLALGIIVVAAPILFTASPTLTFAVVSATVVVYTFFFILVLIQSAWYWATYPRDPQPRSSAPSQ